MSVILLHLSAVALYSGLAIYFWQTRWSVANQTLPHHGLSIWERTLLLAALALHGITLAQVLFVAGAMYFSFSIALSLMFWLTIAFYWIESFYAQMDTLQILGLPLAALGVSMPLIFPANHLLANTESLAFRVHFLMAMLAYSLFTLAAMHALLMAAAENNLHKGRLSKVLAGLPPLLTMEDLLFRLIHIAFMLLTLTLFSGIFFSETLFGKALPFNYKTGFAILSWLIFAALLLGRHLSGWRGKVALRWTLAGFIALMLAYVGSRFVLEVILDRTG